MVIGPTPATIHTELRHVVDTRGWISADFHVHSACSPDSRVSLRDRVYEFLADGVAIVATDHNVVCDYAPYIQELGAEAFSCRRWAMRSRRPAGVTTVCFPCRSS